MSLTAWPGRSVRQVSSRDSIPSSTRSGQASTPTRPQQHVEFISQYWRLAGNAGYDASLDRVHARLAAPGSQPSRRRRPPRDSTPSAVLRRVSEHRKRRLGSHRRHARDRRLGARRRTRSCSRARRSGSRSASIRSRRRPKGVLRAAVDVGRGDRDEDYAGKDLKGAVVLGDADVGQLWRRAVANGGAIGVISTALAPYVSPDPPGAKPTPRDEWDILQWGSIPYDAARKGFGFKASPRAAARLRQALGPRVSFSEDQEKKTPEVFVRVTIASSFSTKPNRTLVAEIPGTGRAQRARHSRRARPGTGRERQRQRRRDARRAGRVAPGRDPRGQDPAAGPDAHVPLSERDRRQPALAPGSRRPRRRTSAT